MKDVERGKKIGDERTIGSEGCRGSGEKRNQLFPSSGEQLIVHSAEGTVSNHHGRARLITNPLR